jgi:hypothetical protein
MSVTISTTLELGITIGAALTVTSTGGVIASGDSPAIFGNTWGALENDGMLVAGGLSTVYLAAGGRVDNGSDGTIMGGEAINISGNGVVTNTGTITGEFLGIFLNSGNIYNLNRGLIGGGVALNSGTVVNEGQISSAYEADISFRKGGSVFNLGTGATLSGLDNTGVYITGGGGLVVNQGVIESAVLGAGGVVDNTGYLGSSTADYGLSAKGATTSVQNTGLIIAASFASAAEFTNASAGIVSGYNNGIVLGYGGDVSNEGTILALGGKAGANDTYSSAPGLAGIVISNGGVIVNAVSALIDGRQQGISITGSLSAYVQNEGTIIGDAGIENAGVGYLYIYDTGTITGLNGTAINLGDGTARIVIGAGAQINGQVIAYHAGDQVVFNSSAGYQKLAGLSTQFVNITKITNAGADIAFSAATALSPGATLVNSGTIQANGSLENLGTIINKGSILGGLTLDGPVFLGSQTGAPIILSNASAGVISSAQGSAVDQFAYGAAATIFNAGIVAATAADGMAVSLSINLDSVYNTGSIVGGAVGVQIGNGYLYNYGFLSGSSSGLISTGSATVYNYAGEIQAGPSGIGVRVASGYVYNAATISGGSGVVIGGSVSNANAVSANEFVNYGVVLGSIHAGVVLSRGGYVYNYGSISGAATGVSLTGAGAVYNSGMISATRPGGIGVKIAGAAVYNYKGGVINGNALGVQLADGAFMNNYGVIEGGLYGVDISGAAVSLVNSGTIYGGVEASHGATIIDTGLITAGTNGNAVYFYGGIGGAYASENLLVINAAASLQRHVDLGGGTLEIKKDGKKVTTLTSGFSDIGTLKVDSKAMLHAAGTIVETSMASVLNNGTILLGAGDHFTLASDVSGQGMFDLGPGGALVLNGGIAAKQVIDFIGAHDTLSIGQIGAFNGAVEGFTLGDTIDLTGVALSSVESLSFSGGKLTIGEGAATFQISFTSPNSFGSARFSAFADGAGIGITLSSAPTMQFATPASEARLTGTALPDLLASDAGWKRAASGAVAAIRTFSSAYGSLADSILKPNPPNLIPVTLQS